MFVATSAGCFVLPLSSSSCDRSSPLVFLTAVLEFLGADLEGRFFSSSASRASFSAFLRAASAFFAASASLEESRHVSRCIF